MRKFIKNIIYISIPFLIYLIIIFVVDPFNYYGRNSLIEDSVKYRISYKIEPHLFKLIDYENNPNPNIALGDSRVNSLCQSDYLSDYSDLSYGGASLNEMIQTFWYAVELCNVDTVLMGISFNLYNKYNKRFWVEETIARKKNIISYSFNKYTFKSTYLILKSLLKKQEIIIGKPPFTKEEFWEYQLGPTVAKFYDQYLLADNYYEELTEISSYCEKNKIKLIIIIPPNHMDFQHKVADYNLENVEVEFKNELKRIADLYDFDIPSDLTENKDNFTDPMHFTKPVSDIISLEVLNEAPVFARHWKK